MALRFPGSSSRAAKAQLLPPGRLSGPMPWVVAIMVALSVIASAAGLAFNNTARNAADALSGGITVQIVNANRDTRNREAQAAVRALRATPGVVEAHQVSQEQVNRLIEPWLGASVDGDEGIPVPALVDARMRDPVSGEMLGALRRMICQVAPSAHVDAQSNWLKPVFSAIGTMRWIALAVAGLLFFALAAAVLLAVRTALGANRETIEIVHLLGGTDVQIARVFQRMIALEAAAGGLVGLIVGGGAVLVLGLQLGGLGAGLVSSGTLGLVEWLLLAAIPVMGIALAMITARRTVLGALRKMQ